jgi:transposase-like protein
MSKSARRVLSRKFKLSAVNRMLRGENVSGLARELQVRRKDLYLWRDHFRAGEAAASFVKGWQRLGHMTRPSLAGSGSKSPMSIALAEILDDLARGRKIRQGRMPREHMINRLFPWFALAAIFGS